MLTSLIILYSISNSIIVKIILSCYLDIRFYSQQLQESWFNQVYWQTSVSFVLAPSPSHSNRSATQDLGWLGQSQASIIDWAHTQATAKNTTLLLVD